MTDRVEKTVLRVGSRATAEALMEMLEAKGWDADVTSNPSGGRHEVLVRGSGAEVKAAERSAGLTAGLFGDVELLGRMRDAHFQARTALVRAELRETVRPLVETGQFEEAVRKLLGLVLEEDAALMQLLRRDEALVRAVKDFGKVFEESRRTRIVALEKESTLAGTKKSIEAADDARAAARRLIGSYAEANHDDLMEFAPRGVAREEFASVLRGEAAKLQDVEVIAT